MSYNERMSEALAVVATIDPDAYGTGTETSDIIDMSNHRRVMFIVQAGTIASTGKLDFSVYGSTASNFATQTLLTGKSITQLTQAGTDSDKQAIVEVTAEEVAAQGLRYVRGQMVLTTAGADAGVLALAGWSRQAPASGLDLTSVDEIVS